MNERTCKNLVVTKVAKQVELQVFMLIQQLNVLRILFMLVGYQTILNHFQ